MNITYAIRLFSSFLNATFNIVHPLIEERSYTSDEESINDWLQSNWELLIEKKILGKDEYFEVYGNGADFYGASSRITDMEALPTHKIVVKKGRYSIAKDVLNDETIQLDNNLIFDRLVGFEDGFYVIKSEFNHVLLNDQIHDKERVISLEGVEFEIQLAGI